MEPDPHLSGLHFVGPTYLSTLKWVNNHCVRQLPSPMLSGETMPHVPLLCVPGGTRAAPLERDRIITQALIHHSPRQASVQADSYGQRTAQASFTFRFEHQCFTRVMSVPGNFILLIVIRIAAI